MALIMTREMGKSHFLEEEADQVNTQIGTLAIKLKGLTLSLPFTHTR